MAHDHTHHQDHERADSHEDTAHLRAEIRETRDRMSETLDQLGTRLNPNRIRAQVRENIREATVGRVENMARHATERVNETRDGILDTIRDNPIPAAMIGIGLGWMIFNGRRSSDGGHRLHNHQPNQLYGSGSSDYLGDVSATTPRLQQDDAAGGIGASISHFDEPGVIDRVRDRVSNVGDTATDIIGEARGLASDVGYNARIRAHRIEDRVSETMTDNPLAFGAVALAVGLAAGFAIPGSRRENQMMGSARDQLVGRVKDVAEDTRDKVQNVAERVIDESRESVREAARDEGLTS